ncbi:hypothetical protein ACIA5A_05915 [Micromonospora sp. NPDC051300]|uniref:hypothetical protein n=1 Tax=Micromonospora sp. NPDC051300 TaxID=3364286 RepID=UPI00378FEB61
MVTVTRAGRYVHLRCGYGGSLDPDDCDRLADQLRRLAAAIRRDNPPPRKEK